MSLNQMQEVFTLYMSYLFIDEVGYGALAGPVLVCGTVANEVTLGCWDSKSLTLTQREKIFASKISCANFLYWVPAKAIDKFGIRSATNYAMTKVISAASHLEIIKIYIDGIIGPKISINHEFIKGGDGIIQQIGLSSIIAKVTRDRMMKDLNNLHPEYGWDKNVGYGTRKHLEAINRYGFTNYHRKSYKIFK